VTGHTGFKGAWLSLWLAHMGAEVHGYALKPPTSPSLYEVCQVERRLAGVIYSDIRNLDALLTAVLSARPDIVIHMAAGQSLKARMTSEICLYYAKNTIERVE
jgi:CDP-glucose 4,6-dehydratase